MEQNRKGVIIIIRGTQTIVLCLLLYLAALDVDSSWSAAEHILALVLPCSLLMCWIPYLVKCSAFSFKNIDWLILGWGLMEFVLFYTGQGNHVATACLRQVEMLCLYVLLRMLFSLRRISSDYISVGILLLALYEIGLGVIQLISGTSRHALYPVTGSFLNPGPYSAILAVAFGMCYAYCKKNKQNCWLVWLGKFILLSSLVMIAFTFSRAALLAVACVVLMVNWQRLKKYWRWLPVPIALAVVLYLMKSGSADGRLLIWNISIRAIKEHFLVGGGLGCFPQAYADASVGYWTRNNWGYSVAGVCDNAFNEYLTLGVEQGVLGIFLLLTVICVAVRRLFVVARPLCCGLVSLLVFAMFSYPFQLLPYRLLLVVMIAYSVSESADRIAPARMSFYGVVVASVLVSAYLEGQIRSRVNAVEAYHGIDGIGSVNLLSDYYVLLPMLNDCPDFLFDFAKGLTSAKRYNDSNAMLQQGTMVSADPMFYVCMGNNYSEMSLFKQAEECYTHALKMVPNRLYPLYKLMKLYETCSNREACHRMARRVAAFREKVSSPAVREMKTKAKQICEQYEKR